MAKQAILLTEEIIPPPALVRTGLEALPAIIRVRGERASRRFIEFFNATLADGRRFRILCVVDDFSRECLATVLDTSLSGVRVARELDRLTRERATLMVIVSDNGTELTSIAVLKWSTNRLAWRTSSPANQCKMPLSKASTASCATNVLMSTCPPAWRKRGRSSTRGGTITITRVRTQASER